ncbi:eukaryotic translation initiation factor 2D-like isoform X2 [Mercenaria mercenaria]|uniref:eukaryotic translation initiation factor 2D-like isoform X2 n=1 Tax=Mercenaria mercenaria TaxID=6596 RepID=UPI00234FAC9D|nr:eukaryotic translation initiation factor 2D-like isoform X2 [Mercenaria mercenaria]
MLFVIKMFKKPFRVKSQSSMKGSDRKKLRLEIQKNFNGTDTETVADIIPNKEEVTIVKIYTHAGDNAFIYCVNKQPLLFEMDKQKVLVPTVYLLWRYPDLIERFTTWPPVFKKLVDGADLMLPGVIVRGNLTPSTFKHVQKGQVCSVNVYGNRAFGDKSSPPVIEDDPLPAELEKEFSAETGETKGTAGVMEGRDLATIAKNNGSAIKNENTPTDVQDIPEGTTLESQEDKEENGEENIEADVGATGGVDELNMDHLDIQGQEGAENEDDATGQPVTLSPEEMDELLQFCFLCAVKSSLKKSDLPLATGTFYKQHVMKYCPKDKNLDIKKSTFKKLSKFLQKQAKTGIVKVKELSKGVDSITEIDKSHELLRGLEVPDVVIVEETKSENEYSPPNITEMFAVTANTLPFFKPRGYSKGSALKPADIRKIITEYVKSNSLQKEESKNEVMLDPILAEMLLVKAEGDRSTLKWDDVYSRLLNKMSPVYEMLFEGQPPVIRKGNVEPIKIDVVQRASNKKATIVENLDLFGIDEKTFAHTVQVKVACSASVVPSQQKNKGPQVVVQGNQIHFVAELLTGSYKIPRKYLKGVEKAPKSKRR